MMIMEAFFYVLRIMAIKSNIANPLALERQLIRGLPTSVNLDYDWLNLHYLSTGKSISKMIYRRLEIFCFAAWDTKRNDSYVLTSCSCSHWDVLFQMQISNQLSSSNKFATAVTISIVVICTHLQLVCVNLRRLESFYVLSFRFVMLANASSGNCKSTVRNWK